jgi:excisionase family DNA binding protein
MPSMVNDLRQPVAVRSLELQALLELQRILGSGPLKLVASSGETFELSPSLAELLKQLVGQMTEGRAVALTRGEKVVTTQQGAAMLGMSRPSFIKLLEEGEIPYHRVGNQRRVLLSELVEYLNRRDRDRWMARAKMDLLLKEIEESGQALQWRDDPLGPATEKNS